MLGIVAKAAAALSILISLLSTTALAYSPEVGTRAANFRGYDLVSRQAVELDDYLGHWVYIDFWGTWCAPCMKDLPQMVEETRAFAESGRLKVLSVNADLPEQLPEVKRIIRELGIDFPVLYDGGIYDEKYGIGYPLPALEWGITGFPATFLINPEGIIVANNLWGKTDLPKLLEFHLSEPRPLMGVSGYARVHEDGTTVSVFASVMNRGRQDVELMLSGHLVRLLWDENNVVTGSEDLAVTPVSMTATLSFDEYCETTHEFVIPNTEKWHTMTFLLRLPVPGAEHAREGGDHGYQLLYSSPEIRLITLERTDEGKWIVID